MPTTLLQAAQGFQTLQEAITWASAQQPPFVIAGVVAQDEFTHDVVFRVAEDGFLVFDTT